MRPTVFSHFILAVVLVLSLIVGFGQACKPLGIGHEQKSSGNGGGYGGLVFVDDNEREGGQAPNNGGGIGAPASGVDPRSASSSYFFHFNSNAAPCSPLPTAFSPIGNVVDTYLRPVENRGAPSDYSLSTTLCGPSVLLNAADVETVAFDPFVLIYNLNPFIFHAYIPRTADELIRTSLYCTAIEYTSSDEEIGYTVQVQERPEGARAFIRRAYVEKDTIVTGSAEVLDLSFEDLSTETRYSSPYFELNLSSSVTEPHPAQLFLKINGEWIEKSAVCLK